MDQMDVDHVPDVPDTPDRLSAQNNNGKSSLDTGSNKFISGRLGNRNLFEGVNKTQFKVNDNGSGKFLMCAPKKSVTSSVSDHRGSSDFASGKPSSSNNSSVLPRRVPDEIPNQEHKHFHPTKNYKSVYAQSSARQDGSVVDLTERNGHVGAWKNVFPSGASGSRRAEEYGKRTLSANRLASSNSMASSSTTDRFAKKGKEAYNIGSGSDCGNVDDCANDTQPKAGRVVSTSNSSAIVPRVTGQKRLVRNGCISPHNIAKTKQPVAEDKNGSDVGVNHALPESSSSPQIASDSHTSKGKGVMNLPSSMKEPGARSTHPPSRNAINIKEIVGDSVTDELRSFQKLGGWRSTRNRSKQNIFPFSRQNQGLPQEEADTCLTNGLPSSIVENGEIRSAAGTSHSNPMDIDATSILDASLPPRGQRASHFRAQLGRFNKHRPAAITLTKRQKQGFTSSTRGECSRAAMDNADILFLGSSENTGKSRTVETVSRNSLGSLDPVIEIDETSPEARGDRSSNGGSSSNDASAMARQIEADEMLARELQEQFYSEVPTVGVGEIDAHAALALQNGEDLSHVFSRRSRAYHARSSSTSNSSRQSQSSSPLSLLHRGSEARAPTLNRMARLRNRFPGQPRTLSSSRERNSLFPVDMDVDMRMYILEALEAISDMGVDNGLLHTQRDFNESDYEMLLALDENNHQHGGASTAQINGLPQSTVQSDNLEEACAICLETPTMGDTIRHLPCLHKFHKDCIDPWLRRKTSCPVCKSSTT